jgi:hypothetical protein
VPALENGARGWDSAPGTADPGGGGGNGGGDPNQDQVGGSAMALITLTCDHMRKHFKG